MTTNGSFGGYETACAARSKPVSTYFAASSGPTPARRWLAEYYDQTRTVTGSAGPLCPVQPLVANQSRGHVADGSPSKSGPVKVCESTSTRPAHSGSYPRLSCWVILSSSST